MGHAEGCGYRVNQREPFKIWGQEGDVSGCFRQGPGLFHSKAYLFGVFRSLILKGLWIPILQKVWPELYIIAIFCYCFLGERCMTSAYFLNVLDPDAVEHENKRTS